MRNTSRKIRAIGRSSRVRITVGVAVLALVAGACGSGGEPGEAADDPITIGVSLPLTGDFSEPGKGVQRGYEAWARSVNDSGGLLGRKVELKILDDQSNADRVVSDYEQLIGKDQVDLVFGPFSTRLVVPSARVAEEYGMLFVEPAGAAKQVFEQGFKNLFYAAPAIADDHYNHLAEHLIGLPADRRPKTAAYAWRPSSGCPPVRRRTSTATCPPPTPPASTRSATPRTSREAPVRCSGPEANRRYSSRRREAARP